MSSRFDGIMLRGLDRLIPVGQEDVLGLEVATVTSEKGERPITVHKLSDPAGVDIQILTYWIDPDPGQRVWLMKTKTQRIIVGVHGGPSIPNDDEVSTAYGSLSGSGGTPAGGYIKHASGFMECWVSASITPVANSWTARTWTFPVAFTVVPAITVVAGTTVAIVQNASYASPAVGSCRVGLVRSNTTSTGFSATARGWWR